MQNYLVIIYDSIFNSVFQGQVVAPLIKKLDRNQGSSAQIISFESKKVTASQRKSLITDPRIQLTICRKLPFMGTISLHIAAQQLKKILRTMHPTEITARGPLAGWIIAHTKTTIPVIVQARGLAAEEYLYTHQPASSWHKFRYWQYKSIEQYVYGAYSKRPNVKLQSVSHALKEYVITEWNTPAEKIIVATHDIPASITSKTVHAWKINIRTKLGITQQAYVYVYNGSAHPWQCPEETVLYFAKKQKKNPNAFLLILSQSSHTFRALLHKHQVPSHAYHIRCVAHTEIYQYLAAADAGLLFREKHCINWVSRPTKALEYQAVGLQIIHNNTIGMLSNHSS